MWRPRVRLGGQREAARLSPSSPQIAAKAGRTCGHSRPRQDSASRAARVVSMPDFHPPDFRQPLDVTALLAATPGSATVKGMYPQRLVELMAQQGVVEREPRRYVTFKDYPMRELMQRVVDAARVLHPRLSLREGIRELGRLVFPTLQASIAGRVMFSFAGKSYESALKRVTQGYALSQNPGSAHLAALSPGEAIVELRGVWNFPDCYQIGVHEGALAWYERAGKIEVRVHSPCDVDLRIRWS